MTGLMPPARRAAGLALLLAALLLAGCTGGGSDGAVGLDGASAAVATVTADGTVAEPGGAAAGTSRVGAGFVVDPGGLVVTTADAVVGAGSLSVTTGADADPVSATLVGSSECLDLAVLRLDGTGTRPFLAWRPGAVSEGAALHAVTPATGAPAPSASSGGAVVAVEDPFARSWAAALSGIRHDLALDAGVSGAPLLDDDGQVAAVAHVEDADGTAALDGGVARIAVQSIVGGTQDVRPLGISARSWADADGTVAGVWVRAVAAGGPAAAAGVQPGDVIESLGGVDLRSDTTLATYCTALAKGGTLDMEVYRPATDQLLDGDTGGTALSVVSTGVVDRSGAFTTVTDASGLLHVDVPVEWASVDGTGFTDAGGNSWYSLVAGPSADRFRTDRTAPGVQVAVTGSGASVVDLLAALSTPYEQGCSPLESVQQYDDGVYAGAYSRFVCSGTLVMVLSVRGPGTSDVAVIVQAASPSDRQHTLPRILSTFGVSTH